MNTPPACSDYEALIVRATDGLADRSDQDRLADHVSRCAACQHALAVQREAKALLAARLPIEASATFRVRVRQLVEAEHERSLANLFDFRRWTWRLAPVAAALAIATTMGVARTSADTDEAVMSQTAAELPVSAALYSDVSESSLLSLMLQANVDDVLGAIEQEQEQR